MRAGIASLVAALVLNLASVAHAQVQRGSISAGSGGSSTYVVDVAGWSTAGVTISGTWTGTVTFEVIGAPGSSAVTVDCATFAAPGTAVNSTTAAGTWVCPVAGASAIQLRFSAYTSGTAEIAVVRSMAAGQSVAASGGSFDGVLVDAAGGDAITDTVNNALRVNIIAGAGSGGTAMTDDAAFTPATTSITPAGAVFDDVTPDSVNEGDGGAVRMSANRNLYSTIRDAAGNERGANVNASNQLSVSVDNTVTVASHAVTNAGTFATQAAQSGTWTVQPGNTANTTPWLVAGNVTPADNTSPTNAAPVTNYNMCFDGTNWDRCTVSTGGSGTIDSNTTRVAVATDDPVNDAAVKTDANMVAHDAVDAGNPLKVGAKASTGNAARTPVANNDRTDVYADADGVLLTRAHSPLADRVSAVVGNTDGASTSLVAAQGAGIRFCATAVTVSNSSATNVTVDLRDGTAGSVIWTFPAAANMGGATLSFLTPLCTSANTALAMDSSAAATTVTVSVIGFKTAL